MVNTARAGGLTGSGDWHRHSHGVDRFAWVPEWCDQNLRFTAGYRWERWWDMTDTGGQNELDIARPSFSGGEAARW